MDCYFAVDIGGTAVKWAVLTSSQEFIRQGEFPTPYLDAEYLAEQIAQVALEQEMEFAGIGVSVPGTLKGDSEGVVYGGGLVKYLDQRPLGKLLQERCRLPVYVENDGKCGALGEYWSGALQGSHVGVVLILGTGVGGGIIIDGKIFKGAHCFAGEMSFLQTQPGKTEDLNQWVGFQGSWKMGLLPLVLQECELSADTKMDGKEIFDLVEKGHQGALRGLQAYARNLAMQIWNLQALLDPDVIAIGGGISSRPVLYEAIRKEMDSMVEKNVLTQFPTPKVVLCRHGSRANLIGAVYFCMQRIEEEGRKS